jgi:hypothetical protein
VRSSRVTERRRRARAWAALIAGVLVSASTAARADAVQLSFAGCERLDTAELRALVELELRGQGADAAPAGSEVRVRCDGERTELVLHGTEAARSFTLGGVPERLRARVVALAVVELSRPAAPVEEAPVPVEEPVRAPAPVPAPVPARAAIVERPVTRVRLWMAPLAAALPLPAAGGALLLDLSLGRLLTLSVSVDASSGRGSLDRGTLQLQSYALRLGPALALTRGAFVFALGAGARVGMFVLRGEPDDTRTTAGRDVRALSAAGALFGSVLLELPHRLVAGLGLEADRELRRVRADVAGGGARTLSPYRVAAVLGLGARW